jgi:hypothetical protein
MNEAVENPPTAAQQLRNSLLIAVAIYLIDAIWLGQGAIAMATVVFVVLYALPRAGWAWYKKNPALRNLRLAKMGIYLVAAALVLATINIDLHFARQRAETVITALKQYQARHGNYPDKLDKLVPEILPAVPDARISLTMNRFFYHATDNSHDLSYIVMPPFGLNSYNLESGRWTVKD